jgi:hypothetical protein
MRTRGVLGASAMIVVGVLASGCDSSSAPGTGQVALLLTDSPIANVQSATVWISSVYLSGGANGSGPRYTLTTSPASYDLLSLQGGVTAALGTATIPTGTYSQLRFVVDSARLTLAGGLTFPGGSSSAMLTVPSGMQTGIKVTFENPVQITPGQTILVADFDVSQSFVLTGPAAAPTGALFKPVIHATVQNVAASIAGTVTPASSQAKVYAIFNSSGDTLATALADATSGAYKLWYLTPGAYTVTAVGSGLNASKSITLRAAEDTTGVDFP